MYLHFFVNQYLGHQTCPLKFEANVITYILVACAYQHPNKNLLLLLNNELIKEYLKKIFHLFINILRTFSYTYNCITDIDLRRGTMNITSSDQCTIQKRNEN